MNVTNDADAEQRQRRVLGAAAEEAGGDQPDAGDEQHASRARSDGARRARSWARRRRAAPPSARRASPARAGTMLAISATSVPTTSGTTIVRVSITRPLEGRSMPIATNSARSSGASAMPKAMPASEPATPSSSPLEQHAAQHLAAVRAERAQQPDLTRALGDGDRERVEDDERADEQRDEAEDQQERLQEAEVVARCRRSAASLWLWPVRTRTVVRQVGLQRARRAAPA